MAALGNDSSDATTTVVSAPGKVLIAGGYLVLEPAYPGLVISTSARFYTVIRPSKPSGEQADKASSTSICVRSPQFTNAEWTYNVHAQGNQCSVLQTRASFESVDAGSNPFVGYALLYALRIALEATSAEQIQSKLGASGLDVYVLADNDFYSQRTSEGKAPTSAELRALPLFNKQNRPIRQVHKTGLGSSAAMTTSLVGALLIHFGVVDRDPATLSLVNSNEALALIHNTAQLAHCAAQGKVGSGFDVSAAVWGSQLYRRFDKKALQTIMDAGESVAVEGQESEKQATGAQLELAPFLDPRNPLWRPSPLSEAQDKQANPTATEGLAYASSTSSGSAASVARPAPLELPPFVELMLADVDSGSNTPSMVGKILQWRKEHPEWAQQMWTILASANRTLADGLLALRLAYAQDSQTYEEAFRLASQQHSRDWEALAKTSPSHALSLLIEMRNAMRSVQGGMRELGRQADVPVEPNEMGDVIKATIDGAHGVIGGGVPGAGGFDALFVLVVNVPSAPTTSARDNEQQGSPIPPSQQEIESVWSSWKALSVGPLLSRAEGAADGASISLDALEAARLSGKAQSAAGPTVSATAQTQQPGGLRIYTLSAVPGLSDAIEQK